MAGDAGDPAPAYNEIAGSRRGLAHVTTPVAAVAEQLPPWVELIRAPNPGPMTLDGTNTWLLRRRPGGPAVVVDPGPAHEEHLRAVAAAGPVAAVLVTHGHHDHVEGLDRFRELTGAEVRTAAEPTTLAGLSITPVATPGHTADSVSFLVEPAEPPAAAGAGTGNGQRVMLTGDTILGRGTTVVAWPDGDLGDYLASLERLAAYPGVPALPGHGPALADCAVAATYYLVHRRARLEQVREVVAAGVTTPAEVVARIYGDVDRKLWGAAEWSVRAQLAYLGAQPPESSPGTAPLDSL